MTANEQVNGVTATEESNYSSQKEAYLEMRDTTIPGVKSAIAQQQNTGYGLVSPYLILMRMNDANSLYGLEMQTNQTRLLQDEQNLSNASSKVLTDLQNIEKAGTGYTTTNSKGEYQTPYIDPKTGIIYPSEKDLQNKTNGQQPQVSDDLINQLQSDYKDLYDMLYNPQSENYMGDDATKYFTDSSIINQFNDMYNQASIEYSSLASVKGYNTGGVDGNLETNLLDGNTQDAKTMCCYMAYAHQGTNEATSNTSAIGPDYIDQLINSGPDVYGWTPDQEKHDGTEGFYNFVHIDLDQAMTEMQNDITQITTMLNNNNDANVDITKSSEQFLLSTAQNSKSA
jgi:hypothetical protein